MAKGYNLEQTGHQVQEAINKSLNLGPATPAKEGLMSAQDKQKLDSLDSELAGKVDKVQGKGLSTNDYDNTEKEKVASAYQKPVNGIPASDLSEGVIPDTSQFITKTVNDLANYYLKTETYSRNETYSRVEVDALIALIKQFTYQVVSELPEASEVTMYRLYLVPSADPQTQNVKDEYITVRSGSEGAYTYAWEQIGSTAINLSGYVTTEALNTALANYTTTANLTTLLAAKQDVIADLSTIRSGAAAGATAYQKPSGGVPKSDLESSVQTSLSKADTAIQPAEFNELEEEVGTIGNGAYEEAWDGSSAPVVADIPAGVSVTYNSTSYTGTLAASASTVDKIYLVSDGNGNYDRYVTIENSGTYSWKKVGTTAIPLSDYATKTEVSQLEAKVDDISTGKYYGYYATAADLPDDATVDGFAYVGSGPTYTIYNCEGGAWTSTGITVDQSPVGNDEDIDQNADGKLQFANRVYNSLQPNGMGYKILRKDATFADQVTVANTIYEIRYNFDLDGETVTVPSGTMFKFVGGNVSNGELDGDFSVNSWNFSGVEIDGNVEVVSPINVPEDNPKEFIETILEHKAASSVLPTVFNFGAGKVYNWTGVLNLDKKNITLTGGGTIEGTIHLGLTKQDAIDENFGTNWTVWHFDYIIQGLRFSKYSVIGTSSDGSTIVDYIKNASSSNDDNVAISLVNVAHVKIADCFFDNVPYPIVYRPNSTYVNQNVRRLNVTNCDFERCHTGIYAPSIVKSPTEYGDLLVANCNFYPTHSGIDCECIDGFKLFNNIFNTGASDTNPFNVKAYMPGQVVMTGNSFYGEYNDYAVMLDSPGNALIVGNLFSTLGTAAAPTAKDMGAALILKNTQVAIPCLSLTITGNQFLNINKPVMISNGLGARTCSISGNTMTQNATIDSYRMMWVDTVRSTVNYNELQSMLGSSIPNGLFGNNAFRANVIKDTLVDANYGSYQSDASKWNKGKFYLYNTINVKVDKVEQYEPITVVQFNPSVLSATASDVSFIFNGVMYSVSLSNATSNADALNAVISQITTDWGDDFNFSIIGKFLWIVGKSTYSPCNSLFYQVADNPGRGYAALSAVYENLGYRIEITDTDGKNRIGTSTSYLSSNYYGICGTDNGKLLNFSGKTVTLKATNVSGRKGRLYFRAITTPISGYNFVLLDNDTFFGFDSGTSDTTETIVSSIVTLAYSGLFTVTGNYLDLIEESKEFYYLQNGSTPWYWTWSGHVADYSFVTDDGRIYDAINNRLNDSGTTAQRPAIANVRKGFIYFDETLGKCIISNGTAWVNMDGTALS